MVKRGERKRELHGRLWRGGLCTRTADASFYSNEEKEGRGGMRGGGTGRGGGGPGEVDRGTARWRRDGKGEVERKGKGNAGEGGGV